MNPLGILAAIVALGKARKPTTAPWGGSNNKPTQAKAKSATKPAVVTKKTASKAAKAKAKTQPIPWPAGDVPEFNPRDWEPDVPLRAEVTARALQLIPTLHKRGLGATVTEYTGGRWIAYVARMHGTKRAVEAFRQRRTVPRPAPKPTPKAPAPVANASHTETPAQSQPAPSVALPPTIREGSRGEDVAHAQKLLGVKPDGIFGPITRSAVLNYQGRNGLLVDGIVGPQTWAHLLGAEA